VCILSYCQKLFHHPSSALFSVPVAVQWDFFLLFFFSHVFCTYCCCCLLLVVVDCYLLGLWCFDHLVKTFVTRFVVVPLFLAVSTSDYDSAFSTSSSLQWLLLVPYGSSDRLALICSPFTFIIALCSLLRGSSHLFVLFPNYCNYLWLNTLLPHRVLRFYFPP
jgi:hypothetical protein